MIKKSLIGSVLLALFAVMIVHAQSERVVIVVSKKSLVASINMSTLRQLFLCERMSWQSGQKVTLFSRSEGTPEHLAMIRSIFNMNESEYKQYLLLKQMRGEESCRVTNLPSKGMSMAAVNDYPGALVLIRASEVTADMKVLVIDGKKPEDPGYPL